jgi:hypothetical protein
VTDRLRRFTKADPCPICGGHESDARGKSVRCFGYYDRSGKYARCTREEVAEGLPPNSDGTYSHRLHGRCRCGRNHDNAPTPAGSARPAAPGVLKRRAQQRFRSFFTMTAYLRRRYGEGTDVRFWVYQDAAGREAFRVLRVDYRAPGGSKAKSYRPCHRGSDGRWRLAKPDGLLPLYNLPHLLAPPGDAVVTIQEGEKCVDIAAELGLTSVTTSAHGARSPQLSDWSPLAGRRVAIIRDEGERGAEYATKISSILAALNPPPDVRVFTLPGLSDGEDIEQWVAARRAAGCADGEILSELRALLQSAFL